MDDLAPFRGTIRHGQGEKEVEDPSSVSLSIRHVFDVLEDGAGGRVSRFDWGREGRSSDPSLKFYCELDRELKIVKNVIVSRVRIRITGGWIDKKRKKREARQRIGECLQNIRNPFLPNNFRNSGRLLSLLVTVSFRAF